MEISVATAVFQVPNILNKHPHSKSFFAVKFSPPTPHFQSYPWVTERLSTVLTVVRGLQKRLFGVPKLEDANMAGTKEATVIGRYLDVPLEVRINGWQTGYFTYLSRWWQLNYFWCSSRTLGKSSILTEYFFEWVGSTTNQVIHGRKLGWTNPLIRSPLILTSSWGHPSNFCPQFLSCFFGTSLGKQDQTQQIYEKIGKDDTSFGGSWGHVRDVTHQLLQSFPPHNHLSEFQPSSVKEDMQLELWNVSGPTLYKSDPPKFVLFLFHFWRSNFRLPSLPLEDFFPDFT